MSAYTELTEYLLAGEEIEAICFGDYGWGGEAPDGTVPVEAQGRLLSLEEAAPMMQSWSFYSGYGVPQCHSMYCWTNFRIIFVIEYDGATGLRSVPGRPKACTPETFGG